MTQLAVESLPYAPGMEPGKKPDTSKSALAVESLPDAPSGFEHINGATYYSKSTIPDNQAVRAALTYKGTPYKWGGNTAQGIDCSGLTCNAYKSAGVNLPRTAQEQAKATVPVSKNEARMGDLVFFNTKRGENTHVGIYMGNGQFVHASTGKSNRVIIDNLDGNWNKKNFAGFRRVGGDAPAQQPAPAQAAAPRADDAQLKPESRAYIAKQIQTNKAMGKPARAVAPYVRTLLKQAGVPAGQIEPKTIVLMNEYYHQLTPNMVKARQAQKDWKPIGRFDVDWPTVKTEASQNTLNAIKSVGQVASGVAQFGLRAAATLGAGAEPGLASKEGKAAANTDYKPPKGKVANWLAEATTPFSKEEVAGMLPSPTGIYKGLASGDREQVRQSLGSIANDFYEGYSTAPEQFKTGEIAPLLNSLLMTAGAVKGGFDITKRLRSPKAGRLVKVAVDETRAGNTQKALPAWEDVIDMVETQEKGRIVWKDPQDRASVINALASPVKAELPKVRANTALPEPRPAKLGEPIVTAPPEGMVPAVVDRGYTAPSPGAMPIPFQRIPELAKGTRVQFAQPAGMKEAGEFVVKAADRKTVTLRNANTGVSLKTTPAKLKVAAEQTAGTTPRTAGDQYVDLVKRRMDIEEEFDNFDWNAPEAEKRFLDAEKEYNLLEKQIDYVGEQLEPYQGYTGSKMSSFQAMKKIGGLFGNGARDEHGLRRLDPRTGRKTGSVINVYDWDVVRDGLREIADEPWSFGWPPDGQKEFSAWLSDILSGRKETRYANGHVRVFGENADQWTGGEVQELKGILRKRYFANLREAKTELPEPFDLSHITLDETPAAEPVFEQTAAGKQASMTGKAKSASESGKANIGTLMKVAGYGSSALALYTLAKRLQNDPKAREDALEEKARQFGEGGFTSRAFDALNALSYLSTAVQMEAALPGKQGVGKLFKNRAQWSDVSAIGLLPDIAFDPMAYITPIKILGIAAKPLKYVAVKSGLTKTFSAAAKTISETAAMRKALDLFEFDILGGMGSIRRSTVTARKYLDKRTDEFIIKHGAWMDKVEPLRKHIVKLGRKFGKDFDKDVARVAEEGWEISARGTTLSFDEARRAVHNQKIQLLKQLEKDKGIEYAKAVREAAEQVMEFENKSADLLVEAGQLSREVAEKWRDVHLRRMYERFEDVEEYLDALARANPLKAQKLRSSWEMFRKTYKTNSNRIDFSATKMRQDLPEEIRDILQEIPYASVRLMDGQDVAANLAFKSEMHAKIAREIGLTEEQVARLGGKVKDYMFIDPEEILSLGKEMGKIPASKYFGDLAGKWIPQAVFYDLMSSLPADKSVIAKFAAKNTSTWKMWKVPLSLVTSMRNFYTNIILADVLGKTSPYRLDIYYKSLRSLVTKDDTYKEAKAAGTFLTDTFTHAELQSALKEAARDPYSKLERIKEAVSAIAQVPSKMYNANEQWFKLAVYNAAKERGLNPEKAADFADRALFNYRKLPKGLDVMRRHGFMPFVAFPFKAIPATFKAFWTDPARLSKYAKAANAVDQRTPEDVKRRERAVMPEYMKDMIRVPGKEARYFDVEYLLPYGAVNDYLDVRWMSNINPAIGTSSDILHNRNMFTGAPIADEALPLEERTKQYIEHALRFALPSMTPRVGSTAAALKGLRHPGQEEYLNNHQIAYLLGFKTNLLDTDKSAAMVAWQIRRAAKEMVSGIRKVARRNGIEKYSTNDDLKSKLPRGEARLVDKYMSEFEKSVKASQEKLKIYNAK